MIKICFILFFFSAISCLLERLTVFKINDQLCFPIFCCEFCLTDKSLALSKILIYLFLLSSSFTSAPAHVLWPHNLVFSFQSLYVVLLALLLGPLFFPLSSLFVSIFELYPFIPYLLHPLQSSSVGLFFASKATPAVYQGRASEEPVSSLCNLGLWDLKELQGQERDGAFWDQELQQCGEGEGSVLRVEEVSTLCFPCRSFFCL